MSAADPDAGDLGAQLEAARAQAQIAVDHRHRDVVAFGAAELRLALIGVRIVEADAGVGADAVAIEPRERVLDARGEAPVVAERELRLLVPFAQAAER